MIQTTTEDVRSPNSMQDLDFNGRNSWYPFATQKVKAKFERSYTRH